MARTTAARGANRARLIEAAYAVLTERGYEATSIKAVAQAAGVAPGLIHYYFASKEELLAAVVEDAAERYAEEMRQLRESLPPARALAAAIAARKRRVKSEPDRERLRVELFALGVRHPALRPAVAGVLATGRAGVAQMLAPTGQSLDEGITAALLAMLDGVALQRLLDPGFDLDAAYRAVERLAKFIAADASDA
jgi:AcrR family transcriptional regulator